MSPFTPPSERPLPDADAQYAPEATASSHLALIAEVERASAQLTALVWDHPALGARSREVAARDLLGLAARICRGPDGAAAWLDTPHPALDSRTPRLAAAASAAGLARVRALLIARGLSEVGA